MFVKKILVLMMVCLLVVVLVVGCSNNSAPSSEESQSSKDSSKKDTVVFVDEELTNLDPQYTYESDSGGQRIMANIYESLVRFDDVKNRIIPAAAESWEISEDGKEYTFHLFKGNLFHNGNELKASDVKFTFDRAMKSPYVSSMVSAIEKVEVIDDYTVKIFLKYPYAPFLKILASQSLSIVNEAAVKEFGDTYGKNPVGTGAYKFVEWKVGDKVVLEAYDKYHFGEPSIKNLIFKVMPDRATALVALQNGEIDVMLEVLGPDRQIVLESDNLTMHEEYMAAIDYLIFNTAKEPFNNVLVRKAIAYSLNLDDILNAGTYNDGLIAENVIPPSVFGYTDKVKRYPRDIEKAKELLREAGYPDGFEATMNVWAGSIITRVAQVIQDNLSDIGIKLDIVSLEGGAFLDALANGNFDIAHVWIMFHGADPDKALTKEFHSKNIGQTNYSSYSNDKLDKLLDEGRITLDEDKRKKIYEEVTQILHDDVPYIPWFISRANVACPKDLKGVVGRPLTRYYVDEWSWE